MLGFISVTLVLAGVLSAATGVQQMQRQQQYAYASSEEEPEPEEEEPDTSQDESSQPDPPEDDNPTGEPTNDPSAEPTDDSITNAIEADNQATLSQPTVSDPSLSLVEPELVDCPDGTNQAATLEECPKDDLAARTTIGDITHGRKEGTGGIFQPEFVTCDRLDSECTGPGGGTTGPTVPISPTTGPIMNQEETQQPTIEQAIERSMEQGQPVFNKQEILPAFSPETQLQMRATDNPKQGAMLAVQDLEQQGAIPQGTFRAINLYEQGDPAAGRALLHIIGTDPNCNAGPAVCGGGTVSDPDGGTSENLGWLLGGYFFGKLADKALASGAKAQQEFNDCMDGGGTLVHGSDPRQAGNHNIKWTGLGTVGCNPA